MNLLFFFFFLNPVICFCLDSDGMMMDPRGDDDDSVVVRLALYGSFSKKGASGE